MILTEEGLRSIYGMLPARLEVSASDSYSVLSVLTYAYMIVVVVAMLSSREGY